MDTTVNAVPEATDTTPPRRWLWPLVAVMAFLLIAAFVAATVLARTGEVTYPKNSPQSTVQRYVRLLQDGRVDEAYNLTDSWMERQEFHDSFDGWSNQSHTVTMAGASKHGDEAVVTVDISSFSAGPFNTSTDTNRTTFTLTRYGKVWLISGPDYLPY